MTMELDARSILAVLVQHDVEFVIIGGLGAVLHGSPSMTVDVDIMPSRASDNLDRLAEALRALSVRLRTTDGTSVAFDPHPSLLGGMLVLNMRTPHGDLDVTFSPSALENFDDVASRTSTVTIGEVVVQVASLDDIIASKQAADRPKDRAVMPILLALREEIERGRE